MNGSAKRCQRSALRRSKVTRTYPSTNPTHIEGTQANSSHTDSTCIHQLKSARTPQLARLNSHQLSLCQLNSHRLSLRRNNSPESTYTNSTHTISADLHHLCLQFTSHEFNLPHTNSPHNDSTPTKATTQFNLPEPITPTHFKHSKSPQLNLLQLLNCCFLLLCLGAGSPSRRGPPAGQQCR